MLIRQLKLTNFRNYPRLDVELPPGLVLLHGDNAQGKTNLLEAVSLLSLTRSFRADSERELITWGAEPAFTRAEGIFLTKVDSVKIEIAIQQGTEVRKRLWLNGLPKRAGQVLGQAPTASFSAQDMDLVSGPPNLRRRYLDILACQLDPAYLRHLQRYQKVLERRNRLLRLIQEQRAQPPELEFWNQELTTAGAFLISHRHGLTNTLRIKGDRLHQQLTQDSEPLLIEYHPSVQAEDFARTLAQNQAREVSLGQSLYGPHRDDLRFLINTRDMGTFASRGQQRTIVLALKLAEAGVLAETKGETPILLLDDIFSELDPQRQSQLMATITSDYQQVLITATSLDSLPQSALARATCFLVQGGQLYPSPEIRRLPIPP